MIKYGTAIVKPKNEQFLRHNQEVDKKDLTDSLRL